MAAISFPSSLLCRGLSAEAFSAVFYMDARASHSPEKHSAAESPWPPSEVNIVDVCSGKAQMHGAHNFWLVPKPTNITLAHTKGLLLQVVCRHTSLSGMVSALGWVFIMQEFQSTCCCAIHTIEEQGHEEIHFLLPFFISTVVIFFWWMYFCWAKHSTSSVEFLISSFLTAPLEVARNDFVDFCGKALGPRITLVMLQLHLLLLRVKPPKELLKSFDTASHLRLSLQSLLAVINF